MIFGTANLQHLQSSGE